MKKGFILYKDSYEPIKQLSLEERGELLSAIFEYNISGNIPEMSDIAKMAFQFLKPTFDRDMEKYAHICDRNSKNGANGGRPKKPKETQKTQSVKNKPKKAHIDIDIDKDIDIDIDKDIYNNNVHLSKQEHTKLIEKFGEVGAQKRIENLSNYIASKGKKYKSHYHTILMWEEMDKKKGQNYGKQTSAEKTVDAVNRYISSLG